MRPGTRLIPRLLVAWLIAGFIAGCGVKNPPAAVPAPTPNPPVASAPAPSAPPAAPTTPAIAPAEADPVGQLRSELDNIFNAPAFDRMMWGVEIQSLATGEVLYQLNSSKLMMPASNMKIVTLAAAAERLGWDYTFETKLFLKGPVERAALHGDLIVVGSGDPTVNARAGSLTAVFDEWAAQLKSAGINSIDGRVIADDRAFDGEQLGAGWSWDYLVYGYAAPVTALQYNENVAELVVAPGAVEGAPASVLVRPDGTGITIVNRTVTCPTGSERSIELRRLAGSDRLQVSGTLPLGSQQMVRTIAVDNPARFFAQALRNALVANGVTVRGEAMAARDMENPPDTSSVNALFSRRSAPLSEIAKVLMKVSQNLYAETLLKTLGLQAGSGTVEAGEKVVAEVLESWGVAPESHVLVDGSGLSRYNYVTAGMLAQILRHVYMDPRHRGPFIDALPVAGIEGGTLGRRMKGTAAAGNVRAKTGSIANVRSLSGFVQTAEGEPLVFSIIGNNFTQPQATIDATIDLAAERLANFKRKPTT